MNNGKQKNYIIPFILCMICTLIMGYSIIQINLNRQNSKEMAGNEESPDMNIKQEVITAEQAREIMDSSEGYVILDVREEDEYAEGHIDGAVRLSYTDIGSQAESVLTDKNQLILVYCRSGRRSAIATEELVKLGYTNVKDFGGIIDWPYEVVK